MIRILRFLFTGSWHEHNWETVRTDRLVDENRVAIGSRHILRCKECGKISWMDCL